VTETKQKTQFGDFAEHDQTIEDLYGLCGALGNFPDSSEYERIFLLAATRRTLSLNKAFRQAVESQNGQVVATLLRLNLDTVSRSYALYWAEHTEGMTAETFAKAVFEGKKINQMKFQGAKEKASDRWLIKKIEGLGKWIPEVYKRTSGAVHFSDFHIKQMLEQAENVRTFDDGLLHCTLVIGPDEKGADLELYREYMQAYLHITMIFVNLLRHRIEIWTANQN